MPESIPIDPLEKIAELMVAYYNPIQMIEHKYKTKVTAIGLLKQAQLSDPVYIDPYYHRLVSYKGLIKDHTDNLKLIKDIAIKIFAGLLKSLFGNYMEEASRRDCNLLNYIVCLMSPAQEKKSDDTMKQIRRAFVEKYNKDSALIAVSGYLLNKYLNTPDKYDILADIIVRKCLTGVTQEAVEKKIASSRYNYFIYGIYSKEEAANIYNISLMSDNELKHLKYFIKIKSMAWSIINNVGSCLTTVNFFGKLWDTYSDIEEHFIKNTNITVMFY